MDVTEKLFRENETKTNRLGAYSLIALTCLIAIFGIVIIAMIIGTEHLWTGYVTLGCCLVEAVLSVLMRVLGYENIHSKYIVLIGLIFIAGFTFFIFPLSTIFLLSGPLLISVKYYDPKLTLKIGIASWLMFILAVAANMVFEEISEAIKGLHSEQGMVLWQDLGYTLKYYVIPRTAAFLVLTWIGCDIARAGRKLVLDQAESIRSTALMTAELDTAAKIQRDTLAAREFISPDKNMTISAGIKPAREVCGDFYDYFMINDHLLVTVVADVSDKGLPAAMYAVEAQSYLRFAFSESFSKNPDGNIEYVNLEEAMNAVNRQLVAKNMDDMFVTMWIGCIDTRTGVGKYVNAGHNMPYLLHADGSVTSVESEPQFFMGSFENAELKAKALRIHTGDRLILYTDGITDLRNDRDETFGDERLRAALEHAVSWKINASPREIRLSVVKDLMEFEGKTRQYDDATFMAVSFDGVPEREEWNLDYASTPDCASKVIDFVNEKLKNYDCPDEFRRNLDVMIDEICSNIFDYAYDGEPGPLSVAIHLGKNCISLRFIDEGAEFNPLLSEDPDVKGEPQIGGLGIYFVKNLSDKTNYRYEDGKNILTIYKIWNM